MHVVHLDHGRKNTRIYRTIHRLLS
jgi:hypothetical protein